MKAFQWRRELIRAKIIAGVWMLLGFGYNAVSPRPIAWVGTWPSTYGSDSLALPPSYMEGDPPILRLDEAVAKYQSRDVVFIDARDPADYGLNHIPGAVNLPFDYYDEHVSVLGAIERSLEVVTYCGGADCELSLFLARQLVNEGYARVFVFFGGHSAWEKAGLPLAGGGT